MNKVSTVTIVCAYLRYELDTMPVHHSTIPVVQSSVYGLPFLTAYYVVLQLI